MKTEELKKISEQLIDTFNQAGRESIDLYSKGLKISIKEDKSPVSNGDLRVNEFEILLVFFSFTLKKVKKLFLGPSR